MSAVAPVRTAATRREAPDKVTGRARYAFEHSLDEVAYAWPVTSTVAKGSVRAIDVADALARPGVLTVLWADNAPRLGSVDDPELELFQSRHVAYRGQFVAGVVATTLEAAKAPSKSPTTVSVG